MPNPDKLSRSHELETSSWFTSRLLVAKRPSLPQWTDHPCRSRRPRALESAARLAWHQSTPTMPTAMLHPNRWWKTPTAGACPRLSRARWRGHPPRRPRRCRADAALRSPRAFRKVSMSWKRATRRKRRAATLDLRGHGIATGTHHMFNVFAMCIGAHTHCRMCTWGAGWLP